MASGDTGLALSTMMATGSASLPAHSFSTGSAVLNMLRQIGMAVGVAVFIAALGTPQSAGGAVDAYRNASVLIAATALAAGVVAVALLSGRRAHVAATATPAVGVETA